MYDKGEHEILIKAVAYNNGREKGLRGLDEWQLRMAVMGSTSLLDPNFMMGYYDGYSEWEDNA